MKQFLQLGITVVTLLVMTSFSAFAQTGTISGKVLDADSGEPLIGANVVVKGTTKGSTTDLGGNFKIGNVDPGNKTIVITYVGYQSKELAVDVSAGQEAKVGEISLPVDAVGLDEIEIIASVAVDRKTPVAVSTIKEDYIIEKAGNQEFPELLKTSPGIYATKQGGGFGDSRVTVRGFNDENVAVLINGVPVNDMENGNVYWSNWAGLTDVTRSMQVQRGLGASKVAVPSIGGTINILTKTTDAEKGGYLYYGIGNDNYNKLGFSLSTGLTENNWAVTVAAAKIEGDGWADGLQFKSYNYFLNVSKMINEKHTISLTGFGAPQWHGQRQNRHTMQTFRDAPQGIKFNSDWGVLNGDVVNAEDNYYHKPQFSLNHYWTINETSELSTAVYASIGDGGGGGRSLNSEPRLPGNGAAEYGPIDFDAIAAENAANPDGSALSYLYNSVNKHEWYGVLSTYNKEINSNLDLLAGVDLRYYVGHHYREIKNLLGAQYYLSDDDVNNPNRAIGVGDKFSYNNDGKVLWEGVFAQGEYTVNKLSTFLSLAASNTSYQRIDFFQKLDSDSDQKTDYYNFFGYQIKGGANYNLTRNHNVFANVGYFEKAPGFDAVFPDNNNDDINGDAENQKILSYEVGYGFRSTAFNANFNVYRTQWKDRTLTASYNDASTNQLVFLNLTGVEALHQGLELDFTYSPVSTFTLRGMFSMGDWTWQNDIQAVNVLNEDGEVEAVIDNLYLKDLKVGNSAQTTLSLGLDYTIVNNLKVGATYNYYADNYAYFEPNSRSGEDFRGIQPWKIPDFGLFDLNAVFDFEIGDISASLYGNVTNLFNTEYVSDATDAETIDNVNVYYGIGRQWTAGVKIKF
ncbi:TonB-dependent receptor [Fulvivirga maritima]|uniref:TonB-dependent receptor n=1 Tax=Fulvivirga maritima TaxID=2904247 RepID=UPI001F375C5E|nr:TonB-dependent receptor [Fulvivirga maritima]UII27858.1 TonB-dependent receptor [Fulvivirga maritima]